MQIACNGKFLMDLLWAQDTSYSSPPINMALIYSQQAADASRNTLVCVLLFVKITELKHGVSKTTRTIMI